MDPSLVVLLCVFVLSTTANAALAAYQWHRSRQASLASGKLLSSAMEVAQKLEQTVAQRSSMADEVAALRAPLVDLAARAKLLSEDIQSTTKITSSDTRDVGRHHVEAMEKTTVEFTTNLRAATLEMAGNLAGIPKMVEALAEIGKVQLRILEESKAILRALHESLYSRTPGRHFQQPSPEQSDQEYEIQQIMSQYNVSREGAAEAVARDRQWSALKVGG